MVRWCRARSRGGKVLTKLNCCVNARRRLRGVHGSVRLVTVRRGDITGGADGNTGDLDVFYSGCLQT